MSPPTVLPVVEVSPGIHLFERHDATGWGLNVITVKLPAGGTLVYSPSWLDDRTFDRIGEMGAPSILCAPNHFHHLALARYRTRWPDAIAVASVGALPRLAAKGHAGLRPVEDVATALPAGARWHAPEGTRTGEVWLSVPHAQGTTLLVCDAFFNVLRRTTGFTGFMLRRLRVVPGLRISTTYQMLGVSDVARCRASSLAIVRSIAPTEVAFCHGEVLRGADCGDRLTEAIEARWPVASRA